jgi:hypothetical protein
MDKAVPPFLIRRCPPRIPGPDGTPPHPTVNPTQPGHGPQIIHDPNTPDSFKDGKSIVNLMVTVSDQNPVEVTSWQIDGQPVNSSTNNSIQIPMTAGEHTVSVWTKDHERPAAESKVHVEKPQAPDATVTTVPLPTTHIGG